MRRRGFIRGLVAGVASLALPAIALPFDRSIDDDLEGYVVRIDYGSRSLDEVYEMTKRIIQRGIA